MAKPSEIFLSQEKCIVKLLERFRMTKFKSMATPMEMNFKKLCGEAIGPDLANPSEYRQLIGAMLFLVNTHPHISYVVTKIELIHERAPPCTLYSFQTRIEILACVDHTWSEIFCWKYPTSWIH